MTPSANMIGVKPLFSGRSLAASVVAFVSCASVGETSSDTYPSSPFVLLKTGANTSHALRISWIASASNKFCASCSLPIRLLS